MGVRTAGIAKKSSAKIISHNENRGYINALRTGLRSAQGDIIVVMDADGQHNPDDIPRLIQPILSGEADLVIGAREYLSSSEKVLTGLTRLRVDTQDVSSGFKALKKEIAERMRIRGKCICGTFILEAKKLGAQTKDVRIQAGKRISGKSRVKNNHLIQVFLVLR